MKIGILGSGQLGRMLALAGIPLGFSFHFFDDKPNSATQGIGMVTQAAFDDRDALKNFAESCDVITYEFENVPAECAHFLSATTPVFPPPKALEVSQDRVVEKSFFQSLGLPTPAFLPARSHEELARAIHTIGTPCIVKTCRMGYDGKGQAKIDTEGDIAGLWERLGQVPLIVEQLISFSRELSILGVRSRSGEVMSYPLIENTHRAGILRKSIYPAPSLSSSVMTLAREIVVTAVEHLDYVGVLAIELFQVNDSLIINEMAPRVHNSGHVTLDAAPVSQFENHIRAISGLPLGKCSVLTPSVMHNVLHSLPDLATLAAIDGVHIHMYGKSEAPGRKLGHATLPMNLPESEASLLSLLNLQ